MHCVEFSNNSYEEKHVGRQKTTFWILFWKLQGRVVQPIGTKFNKAETAMQPSHLELEYTKPKLQSAWAAGVVTENLVP